MGKDYVIRDLTEDDIEQIAEARKKQEEENGNGTNDDYILLYKDTVKKLLKEKKLLAVGALINDKLISIACFNLISYGNTKKIPYLCAVWTNGSYRRNGLATKVNEKLIETILIYKEQLEPKALLTLEGNETAFYFYKKLGYKEISGEMSFLGDVQSIEEIYSETTEKSSIKTKTYFINGEPKVRIDYSEEQLLAHPKNLDGKMSRILSIEDIQKDGNSKIINLCLQQFFFEHKFCKFNVKELAERGKKIYKIFSLKNGDIDGLLNHFENMIFKGSDGQNKKITRSFGVMEKDLSNEFKFM